MLRLQLNNRIRLSSLSSLLYQTCNAAYPFSTSNNNNNNNNNNNYNITSSISSSNYNKNGLYIKSNVLTSLPIATNKRRFSSLSAINKSPISTPTELTHQIDFTGNPLSIPYERKGVGSSSNSSKSTGSDNDDDSKPPPPPLPTPPTLEILRVIDESILKTIISSTEMTPPEQGATVTAYSSEMYYELKNIQEEKIQQDMH